MLVKNWMNKPAIAIDKRSSMQEAMNLMKTHRITLLPVMDKNRLVGVLTDRDLKKRRHPMPRPLKYTRFSI